jgi:hypothetical protein
VLKDEGEERVEGRSSSKASTASRFPYAVLAFIAYYCNDLVLTINLLQLRSVGHCVLVLEAV